MICDRQVQIHVRQLGRSPPNSVWISPIWVRIIRTPCHFGGVRSWFECPSCNRRCAILYPSRCRICCNGRYKIELMGPHDRKITQVIKMRRQLGQTKGGTIASFPKKPKWMRWHTYLHRREKCIELEKRMWGEVAITLRGGRQ